MRTLLLGCVLLVGGGQCHALQLTGPVSWQVFQRNCCDYAWVPVTGTCHLPSVSIQVRAWPGPKRRGRQTPWLTMAREPEGTFAGSIRLAAGGWYTLQARAVRDRQVVARASVDRVGVGEVFITCGQSNSTNFGSDRGQVRTGMVSAFDGHSWRLADDPQPGARDSSGGGSIYPWLGDLLVETWQLPVAFATTGQGGSCIEDWLNPDKGYYDWLLARVLALGDNHPRFVLWHQGECNVFPTYPADQYARNMETLVNRLNTDIGYRLDWITCRASFVPEVWPGGQSQTLRAQQQLLWDRGITLRGPDTDDLRIPWRANDNLHMSRLGLQEIARRYHYWIVKHIASDCP